jgi:LuxR family transcriptional regulator, maltose regulon positive regulatory protein
VLSSQPESLQEFLLQTAFLNRLTGSLCNAVTGRNDSELMLEQLERANLFLIPLDDARQWYRYHALFAEAMQHEARRRLGEDHLRSLYDKASLWYEQHGLLTEAIEVALYARDFARAAMLIEHLLDPQHLNEELHTLHRWIEELPEEVLALRSQVALWQGDLPQAFAAARQALEWLPADELLWRGSSMLTVGMEELLAGKTGAARQATLGARACFEVSGNIYGTRATLFTLGEVSARQGELRQAASLYRQVLTEAEEDPLDKGSALINLAALSYEWNELEAAEQQVSQALELGKQHIGEVAPGSWFARPSMCAARPWGECPGAATAARAYRLDTRAQMAASPQRGTRVPGTD